MAERVRLLAAGDRCSPLAGARGQIFEDENLANFALQSCRTRAFLMHVSSNLTNCGSKEEMAERVRFELTCRNYPTIRFRVGAVMTASVPLRASPQFSVEIRAVPRGARILAER